MALATMFEAKTSLSRLVKLAQEGQAVTITSGRERRPVARLEAIVPVAKKRLGARARSGFQLGEAFFAPLPDEELRAWGGEQG